MPTKAYLVIGTTGEWGDLEEWYVGVYADSEQAYGRANELIATAKLLNLHKNNYGENSDDNWGYVGQMDKFRKMPSGDPHATVNYTGLDYIVTPIDAYGFGD